MEGRTAIAAYMNEVFAQVRFGPLGDVRVHEAGGETVVEATSRHRRLFDCAACDRGFVWIVTSHDGLVSRYRDYMNPLQLAALGGG